MAYSYELTGYKAFLFDLDGTLVASEKLKAKALVETCRIFGGHIDVNYYKEVMGESWETVAHHFFNMAHINPSIEEFNIEFKKIYLGLLQKELMPNPNVEMFLIKLKKDGKRMGIVSSGASWMVAQILNQLDFSKFFEVVIAKENVSRHKPDPEPYLLALELLSLPSSEVLIFEDTKPGLIAAKKAHCDSIAFRHEINENQDLSLGLRIITDYKELLT